VPVDPDEVFFPPLAHSVRCVRWHGGDQKEEVGGRGLKGDPDPAANRSMICRKPSATDWKNASMLSPRSRPLPLGYLRFLSRMFGAAASVNTITSSPVTVLNS